MPLRNTFISLALLLAAPALCRAQTSPELLTPSQLNRIVGEKEMATGSYPGLLVVPTAKLVVYDAKYHQPYRAECIAYGALHPAGDDDTRNITGYGRRFIVHAPDLEAIPLARRVARMLLLAWSENRARLRADHPASARTLDVWLTRKVGAGLSADTGGEQFNDQIYLYDIYADRKPIEWAREVAHEYGHYALPGVSGYTSPENWANGVLGERLFLKWLRDDLKSGVLRPEDIPFVTPDELDDFAARQLTPLIRQVLANGPDTHALARTDAGGMDAYTGFVLAYDTLYGSRQLRDAFALTAPAASGQFVHARDFLRGALDSLREASEFRVTLPLVEKDAKSVTVTLYLPTGVYRISTEGPIRAWQFSPAGVKGLRMQGKDGLNVTVADWRKLTVTLSPATDKPVRLTFRRPNLQGE